jgi:hypothetical protein
MTWDAWVSRIAAGLRTGQKVSKDHNLFLLYHLSNKGLICRKKLRICRRMLNWEPHKRPNMPYGTANSVPRTIPIPRLEQRIATGDCDDNSDDFGHDSDEDGCGTLVLTAATQPWSLISGPVRSAWMDDKTKGKSIN